jgi:hypothetical protein
MPTFTYAGSTHEYPKIGSKSEQDADLWPYQLFDAATGEWIDSVANPDDALGYWEAADEFGNRRNAPEVVDVKVYVGVPLVKLPRFPKRGLRVSSIAKKLGVTPRTVLLDLKRLGHDAKTANSIVEPVYAQAYMAWMTNEGDLN